MTAYQREQRAAVLVAVLYPLFFAAVMFFDVLPWMRSMLEVTA
jgi:hypothetical protein